MRSFKSIQVRREKVIKMELINANIKKKIFLYNEVSIDTNIKKIQSCSRIWGQLPMEPACKKAATKTETK